MHAYASYGAMDEKQSSYSEEEKAPFMLSSFIYTPQPYKKVEDAKSERDILFIIDIEKMENRACGPMKATGHIEMRVEDLFAGDMTWENYRKNMERHLFTSTGGHKTYKEGLTLKIGKLFEEKKKKNTKDTENMEEIEQEECEETEKEDTKTDTKETKKAIQKIQKDIFNCLKGKKECQEKGDITLFDDISLEKLQHIISYDYLLKELKNIFKNSNSGSHCLSIVFREAPDGDILYAGDIPFVRNVFYTRMKNSFSVPVSDLHKQTVECHVCGKKMTESDRVWTLSRVLKFATLDKRTYSPFFIKNTELVYGCPICEECFRHITRGREKSSVYLTTSREKFKTTIIPELLDMPDTLSQEESVYVSQDMEQLCQCLLNTRDVQMEKDFSDLPLRLHFYTYTPSQSAENIESLVTDVPVTWVGTLDRLWKQTVEIYTQVFVGKSQKTYVPTTLAGGIYTVLYDSLYPSFKEYGTEEEKVNFRHFLDIYANLLKKIPFDINVLYQAVGRVLFGLKGKMASYFEYRKHVLCSLIFMTLVNNEISKFYKKNEGETIPTMIKTEQTLFDIFGGNPELAQKAIHLRTVTKKTHQQALIAGILLGLVLVHQKKKTSNSESDGGKQNVALQQIVQAPLFKQVDFGNMHTSKIARLLSRIPLLQKDAVKGIASSKEQDMFVFVSDFINQTRNLTPEENFFFVLGFMDPFIFTELFPVSKKQEESPENTEEDEEENEG